jgi:hypothetical protein
VTDNLSPAAHALRFLHSQLSPEERRELVRVLNMSATLATLWAQVEPTTHETSPGPRVPEPGAPPIMPPEVDAEAFAQAEGEALSRLVDGLFLGRCEASADVNRCAFDARMPGGLV